VALAGEYLNVFFQVVFYVVKILFINLTFFIPH